jgi:transposase
MARPIEALAVTAEEKRELERRVRAHSISVRERQRAEIVLLRSQGMGQVAVARQIQVMACTVSKWTQRFEQHGLEGLVDQPGRGRKPSIAPETVQRIITEAVRPPQHQSRWSTRSMARRVGVSADTVQRIWSANDIKPHLVRQFKISTDPEFEQKFWDVIGLYLNPPERALVLCCDEKTQCQALERTQPALPLGIGHIRTRTHDDIRHGTVTLFAALNYLDGKLISRTEQSHTHVQWLRFLKQIDRETPKDLAVHLIMDNYCTHKHQNVQKWLARHPRFHVHFTPTSSSWLNLVERFFADLTADVVREGSFTHVRQLIASIEGYLAQRNASPRPYRWRAAGEEILRSIQRARARLSEAGCVL